MIAHEDDLCATFRGGKVGIGTSSPDDPLVVQSSGSMGGGATIANSYFTITDGTNKIGFDPNEMVCNTGGTFHIQSDGRMFFQTGGTTARLAIREDGDIVLGTHSVGADGAITFYKESNFVTMSQNTTSSAGNGSEWQVFRRGGTQIGSIVMNGTTGTTYGTSSDYRLKENVDYTWDATTRLKQLKPARFNWISDETNTLQDGFLAHEVSSVVPEAIAGDKDAMETYTDDGVEKTRIKPQGIDHSKLVPLLVKTIQELEARLTAGGL